MNTRILSMSWLLLVAGFLNSSEQKPEFYNKQKQDSFKLIESAEHPKHKTRKKLHLLLVDLLKEKEELGLVKKILQFSYILNICLKIQDPYMLTVYLQELSEAFHKFYDLHRVLSDDTALTQARLGLSEGSRIVIATGLELLGVSRPEKM